MKNTKIYNTLKDGGWLPSSEGWDDLEDAFKEAYREAEVTYESMTIDEQLETDDKLMKLFNDLHELDDDNEPEEKETEESLQENTDDDNEKMIFDNPDVSFGFTPTAKLTVTNNTEEIDDETETSEENSENENDMKKQKEKELETPIEKTEKPKLITETIEETTETSTLENVEEPTEKNIDKLSSVEVSSQTPNNQTGEYPEFVAFCQDKETISAKDFRAFNVPEEVWRRGKIEIRLGNLRIYKTAPSLMFNKWLVEVIN